MWENICLNYRKKYHMRAAHPVHSKNHFANYQLSIASRHRCMEVLFHCHLNTEYLLTRNQTGVYEHTLHDRESNDSIPWPNIWDHWWLSRICKSSWRAQNEMTNFGSCFAIIFMTWSTKIPLIWANELFINVLYLKSIPKFVKWQAKTKQWHKIYEYYLCINPHWFLRLKENN